MTRSPARKKKPSYLERLRQQRLAAQTDRFLARVLLRLLDEPDFVSYLQGNWSVRHELDPTTKRVHIHVERIAPVTVEAIDGCAQP